YYNEFSGPDTNHLQTGEYKFYSQFVADDHGSTKETATFIDKTTEELSKTVTVPGRIGFAGDEDWFKIVTTDVGNLTVKTTGSTDTVVTLYDENNNEVPLDGNSTTRISGERVYSPEEGWRWPQHTYYVRVKHRNPSGTGDYSLVVKLAFDVGGHVYQVATTIQPNSTIQAAINFAGDQDYFKIVLPYAGTLTVGTLTVSPKTNKDATDTYGYLYRKEDLTSLTSVDKLSSEGDTVNWIGANNNIHNDSSNRNFRIIKQVTPGIYYVRVRGYYNEFSGPDTNHLQTGEYKFYSQFVADDHGSTKETATFIDKTTEELDKTVIVPGRIGFAGDEDWFKIVLPRAGTFTVETTGFTDTNGYLYDENNSTPSETDDDSGSDRNFKISKWLKAAGTYYVKVKHHSASLTGSYLLVTHFDDHNNTRDKATSINPDSNTSGSIEMAGDVDWFKVVISRRGTLDIEVDSQTADDINVSLYNQNSSTPSHRTSGVTLKITQDVEVGTYYVKVRHSSASSTGSYLLVSKFTPSGTPASSTNTPSTDTSGTPASNTNTPSTDTSGTDTPSTETPSTETPGTETPGTPASGTNTSGTPASGTNNDYDTLATAYTVTETSATNGIISSASDVDYYKFVLEREGNVTINVATDVTKDLLDSNGNSLESNSDGSTDITRALGAGTYYVKISYASNTGSYLLRLSYTGPDKYGGVLGSRATEIEPNSTIIGTINEPVNGNPDVDVLRMTTPSSGRLTLTYTGSTNIHLKLLDNHNAVLTNADKTATHIDIQTDVIEAGTYYVTVTPGNDDDGDSITGPYSITSRFTPASSQ
ncbi:MAG: pre-peptidase C-terminal domain-containing protein, partial [Sulfurovum sp.]|nr:pre-peptidase C-terminal domain-containing protein [Sulfurovum sp.]